MTDVRETIHIENVVASTSIDQELNLESVADDLSSAKYDPERFPGLIFKTREPKATLLIFRTGRIVVTGAQSEDAIQGGLEIGVKQLENLGIDTPDSPAVTIQNIVCSGDLGQQLNLNAIAIGFGLENVEYEPEQFPGLVYRLNDPEVVVLLFGSGKTVVTGAKTPVDAERAVGRVEDRLKELGLHE